MLQQLLNMDKENINLYCLKGRSPMIHTFVYAGDAEICHNFQRRFLGVGSYFGVLW
jgi:hypothetical protein